MSGEGDLMRAIQLEVTSNGARAFRNNVGQFYPKASLLRVAAGGDPRLERPVVCGLAVGSSDLIGWAPTLIRPEHVGQVLARFLSIEVKTSHGRFSEAQRRFLHAVNQAGGLGLECRDPAQVAKLLSR